MPVLLRCQLAMWCCAVLMPARLWVASPSAEKRCPWCSCTFGSLLQMSLLTASCGDAVVAELCGGFACRPRPRLARFGCRRIHDRIAAMKNSTMHCSHIMSTSRNSLVCMFANTHQRSSAIHLCVCGSLFTVFERSSAVLLSYVFCKL